MQLVDAHEAAVADLQRQLRLCQQGRARSGSDSDGERDMMQDNTSLVSADGGVIFPALKKRGAPSSKGQSVVFAPSVDESFSDRGSEQVLQSVCEDGMGGSGSWRKKQSAKWNMDNKRSSNDLTAAIEGSQALGTGSQPTAIVQYKLYDYWEEYPLRNATTSREYSRAMTGAALTSPKTIRLNASKLSVLMPFGNPNAVHKKTLSERIMASPGSKWRAPWDILGMLLVLYDSIFIPLGTFSIQRTMLIIVMEWVTRVYWTCDIPLTFTVGQFKDGEVIMDPRRVALGYLRSTFALDLAIVVVDWIGVLGVFDFIFSGNAGILRIFRAARILRLLRLFKLQKILIFMQDHVNSEYISLLFDFVKLVFSVLLLSHFAACIFWWIGKSNSPNWIENSNLHLKSKDEQYLAALHLCMMSFLMESVMSPQNSGEFLYCISLIVCGLVIFSTIISRITSLLLEIQNMSADKTQELWKLRRFFRQKRVPMDLSRRITRYLEYQYEQKRQMVQWSELPILDNLTPVLRNQLRYVGHMQSLREHPLFRFIEHVSDVTMQRICESALSEQAMAEKDPLFFQGETSRSMEVLVRGTLLYVQRIGEDKSRTFDWDKFEAEAVGTTGSLLPMDEEDDDEDPDRDIKSKPVPAGTILSESALWVEWRYMGDAYAWTECSCLAVDVDVFASVVKRSTYIYSQLGKYAARALRQIEREQSRCRLSDIWDKARADSILNMAVKDMMTAAGHGSGGSFVVESDSDDGSPADAVSSVAMLRKSIAASTEQVQLSFKKRTTKQSPPPSV